MLCCLLASLTFSVAMMQQVDLVNNSKWFSGNTAHWSVVIWVAALSQSFQLMFNFRFILDASPRNQTGSSQCLWHNQSPHRSMVHFLFNSWASGSMGDVACIFNLIVVIIFLDIKFWRRFLFFRYVVPVQWLQQLQRRSWVESLHIASPLRPGSFC